VSLLVFSDNCRETQSRKLLGCLLLRLLFWRSDRLTQRELDVIYCPQRIRYGKEYPTLILVATICFIYSCITPVILPIGALYFCCALIVMKMQLLHVYVPRAEGMSTNSNIILKC